MQIYRVSESSKLHQKIVPLEIKAMDGSDSELNTGKTQLSAENVLDKNISNWAASTCT